jgi:hypothetical protein
LLEIRATSSAGVVGAGVEVRLGIFSRSISDSTALIGTGGSDSST